GSGSFSVQSWWFLLLLLLLLLFGLLVLVVAVVVICSVCVCVGVYLCHEHLCVSMSAHACSSFLRFFWASQMDGPINQSLMISFFASLVCVSVSVCLLLFVCLLLCVCVSARMNWLPQCSLACLVFVP